jgi:phosphatidylserine decarboxylase
MVHRYKHSRRKIQPFIEDFNIDMNLAKTKVSDFTSFNDFFIRTLNKEARPIDMDPNTLISPGDGRLLAYDNISMHKLIQVKNLTYSLSELLGNSESLVNMRVVCVSF